ncbi:hypothetical protein BD560DRAFT_414962 [Blakeslea trispora]|nr:hypothetical protein BD560DRAFT_414962 [Blakeslea trispora]
MNSSSLSNLPSVRLASGVEMQHRWLPTVSTDHSPEQPKNTESPRVIKMTPNRGSEGTTITVVVQSLACPSNPVKLAFNSLVVNTKQLQSQNITSLVATVPPFRHTQSTSSQVPVSICITNGDTVTATWTIADFIYEFVKREEEEMAPRTSMSAFSTSLDGSDKRNSFESTSCQNKTDDYLSSSNYDSFYSNNSQPYNTPYNYYSRDNKFDYRSNSQNRTNDNTSLDYQHESSNTINLFNPTSSNYTTTMTTQFNPLESNLSPPNTGTSYQSTMRHQQHAYGGYSKSSGHFPTTSVANYQPYPGLVSRANLKMMGDLESMAKNWSPTEWEHRRRLVQFWREQNGNEIRCTFDAISQGERINNNCQIVVSCIYWAERNDCFITSVDCIHLLESLMDLRFSVEEKNRVRRNLEGFRPLTVSKCKPDSADFFKLIMSFPNPKPRNIEKDVKVFPWKTLPYALKKIVTKYTAASYHNNSSSSSSSNSHGNTLGHTIPISQATVQPRSNSLSSASSADFFSARPSSPSLGQAKSTVNPSYYSQTVYRPSAYSQYHPPSSSSSTSATIQPNSAPTESTSHLPMSTVFPDATTSSSSSSSLPAFASPYPPPTPQPTSLNRLSHTPSPRMSYSYQDIISSATEPMMTQATP